MNKKELKPKRGRGRPRIYVMGAHTRQPGEHRAGLYAGAASEGLGLSEARLGAKVEKKT